MWWFRIKGTVIKNIYWQVGLVTLYAAGVVVINKVLDVSLNFPMSLIQVIGVVVGLLLAFRTNSAYDR
jgi:putative membrane protein